MDIYIVILEDRHIDSQVYPFIDPDEAVKFARNLAKENCRFQEDYEEHDYGKDDGWLFFANTSCESDSVRVVTAELNKKALSEDNGE